METLWMSLVALFATITGSFPATTPEVAPEPVHASSTAMVVEVLDGDTVIVEIADTREFVRYIGIDTPEYSDAGSECYAEEATAANTELVAGEEVLLVADTTNRDTYNRLLRYVYVGDTFVNATLVEEGYADAKYYHPDTEHQEEFAALEARAKRASVGKWGACPGT